MFQLRDIALSQSILLWSITIALHLKHKLVGEGDSAVVSMLFVMVSCFLPSIMGTMQSELFDKTKQLHLPSRSA
jgi:hypothetical protein